MQNELAPIILFVYNRPWHTEQTLVHLALNHLAAESTLYIFADGAKKNATTDHLEAIAAVRKVIHSKKWCKAVVIVESETNKGLANSIIQGVSEIVNQHGKVIVLEDDLVTSPFFLDYMNKSLTYYAQYKTVFSISADRPSAEKFDIPIDYDYDVFVSLRNFSYGWGTWDNRWSRVDWKVAQFDSFIKNSYLIKAFNRGGDDLTNMLKEQMKGRIDSWAVRFCFSHFANHAVSILPCISYIQNIGFDGSGTHCSAGYKYKNVNLSDIQNPKFLDIIYEDSRIIDSFYSYYSSKKRPLLKKIINRLSRLLCNRNVFILKGKVYY